MSFMVMISRFLDRFEQVILCSEIFGMITTCIDACVNKSINVCNECMFNTWTIYIYACIYICMYIMYLSLYIFWDTTLVTSPSTTVSANQKPAFNPTAIHHGTTVNRPFHGTVLRRWRHQTYTSLVASTVIGSINSHDFPYPDDPWDWNI